LRKFGIDPRAEAFRRCSRCNTILVEVSREEVAQRVPPFVYASQQRFCECSKCRRVYWRATHPERILAEIERIEGGGSVRH